MTLRTRLMIIFALGVCATVALIGSLISATTRQSFERLESQRVEALVEQFRREYARRGGEIAQAVEGIAKSEAVQNIGIALNRGELEPATVVDAAQAMAAPHGLDFLELVAGDGTILSSAQWKVRYGYKEEWLTHPADWNSQGAFLRREELPQETVPALEAVRVAAAGEKSLYIAGGRRLDREFLSSLVLPAGMRALLYSALEPGFSPRSLASASGTVSQPALLEPLVESIRRTRRESTQTVQWTSAAASAETFQGIPLTGRDGNLIAILLVGSSRGEMVELEHFLLRTSIQVAAGGVLLGILLGWWATSRVTRPVQALAAGAAKVAAGNWNARVDVESTDEIGQLAQAFNQMTCELTEQRERLIQAERVAAWRELARRLAHELKNPLFPMQITLENLKRAREEYPEQFDEVFRESTATLLAELGNLKNIIGRFSDFAKMPPPELQKTDLNALVRDTMQIYQAQLHDSPIRLEMNLDLSLRAIDADPEQMGRALRNLVLNAIDAMPEGGVLIIRTRQLAGAARLEVTDTGKGLTPEECERLFTPYYTSKTHGTGLGLAIVQSVVSDHAGRISVASRPGEGTTFTIELKSPAA